MIKIVALWIRCIDINLMWGVDTESTHGLAAYISSTDDENLHIVEQRQQIFINKHSNSNLLIIKLILNVLCVKCVVCCRFFTDLRVDF